MLGFMNEEAVAKTEETGKVTFFSRTKNRLWTKGEESGNFLNVVSIAADCDNDTLLIKVNPVGPVCHTGADTCWGEENEESDIRLFWNILQDFIDQRKRKCLKVLTPLLCLQKEHAPLPKKLERRLLKPLSVPWPMTMKTSCTKVLICCIT